MRNIPKGIDSLLLFTREDDIDPNFYYFTGMSRMQRLTAYMIAGKGKPVVITNPLEYGMLSRNRNFTAVKTENRKQIQSALRQRLGEKVGINCDYVSVNSMKKLRSVLKGRKFIDVSKQLCGMRAVKAKEEIHKIREACRITEELFSFLEASARKGRTEIGIANGLETEARRLGAEGMAFPPIIASGRNSAVPHHRTGKAKLAGGILLADIGVIYEGYCSDITRTYYIGEPTVMHKHMYAVINSARKEAIKTAKPGVRAKKIFESANSIIKKGYGSGMIHSLGHGLGIEVHEAPSVSSKSKETLGSGMCITIEPGYYMWDFGVRIEDDIVIAKKPVMLSRAPDNLVSL
ncbi:MAG: aminopeptidase P family protein [Candidatus Aenigmarchaeota archaeon]|nr:aminopeptidase P family protein [Candidatus Aenigmarchaeota archaeon]